MWRWSNGNMSLYNSIFAPLHSWVLAVFIPFGIFYSTHTTFSGTIVFCSPKHTCTNVLFYNSIANALVSKFATFVDHATVS
jgi:energy-converting hydrogenase Eha subunit F